MEDEETTGQGKIDNMRGFLGIGDESNSNRIKLNNERKQDYMDYLSKQTDNYTKTNQYVEDVNPDNFLGFGGTPTQPKHGYHKDVILAEKRQISHDQLDSERKEEYQTYLTKKDYHFTKPDKYYEKVNANSFLGFGEEQQPSHGYRKNVNLAESRQTNIEKLQNSLQHASISNNGNSMFSFGQENDDNKQRLLKERRQEYQDFLHNQNDKSANKNDQSSHKDVDAFKSPEKLNVHAQTAKERHLAALGHSPLHNQAEESNSQMNRNQSVQNQHDEKRRQHEQYFEELNQQIADKKQYNIVKANRERLEDEANFPLHDQIVENETQIKRETTLQNVHDEKRRQHEEYFEQLNQQIADNKRINNAKADLARIEDEAIEQYENHHARF
ncbi:interaptin-like [Chrysoperla carnea]|uniref:interaptin-like n=1 Tax=Chrysoperla carnea TaxID=189513 RepID=UPI001D0941D7|nr:interaptin-like [Chrysoperla carnea]